MKRALHVLVLAGGGGTRLWPLSRRRNPKPFLPIARGKSPLRRAVDLALRVAGPGRVWVIAAQPILRRARAHLNPQKGIGYIAEPEPKNTAAALALGSWRVHQRAGARWVLGIPADQWVRRPRIFHNLVRRLTANRDDRSLITFGIRPRHANPGYGYIDIGRKIGPSVFEARRFVEKPPASRAARYLRRGRWVWNSGMFLWRPEAYLAELRRLMPRVAAAVGDLESGPPAVRRRGRRRWSALAPISVDHGILEHAARVAVAPCRIGWQDLGTWDCLGSLLPRAGDGTMHTGRYVSLGGQDCLVYAPCQLTVNIGVRGVGVIATPDVLLLFERGRDQHVRQAVERLKRHRGTERFL